MTPLLATPASNIAIIVLPLAGVALIAAAVIVAQRRVRSAPVDHERLRALQRDWQVPADLAYAAVPRSVRVAPAGIAVFAAVGLFAVLSLGITWFSIWQASRFRQADALLQHDGVATQATISQMWVTNGRSRTHNITYAYLAGGSRYAVTTHVTTSFYNHATVGALTPIHYSASNPGTSRLDSGVIVSPAWLMLAGLIPVLGLGIVPVIVFRQKTLLEQGAPAGAIVTRVGVTKGGWAVTYQFLDASGQTATGRTTVSRREKPEPGAVIAIVYYPGNAARNAPYPLKFVRLSSNG